MDELTPHRWNNQQKQDSNLQTHYYQRVLGLNAHLAALQNENDLLREALQGICKALEMRHATCYERRASQEHWFVRETTDTNLQRGHYAPDETAVLLEKSLVQSDMALQKTADSLLAASPLVAGDHTLGALVVEGETAQGEFFSTQGLPILLQTFAQNLAALWHNLRYLHEVQQRHQELAVLQSRQIDNLWNTTQTAFQAGYAEKGFDFKRLQDGKSAPINGKQLPLLLGDIPFGSVILSKAEKLSPDQLELIQSLTREMGNALNNAYLLQTTRVHANQLALATEVSRAATTILDRNHLIQEVVDLIRSRFTLYYVGLFLVDAKEKKAVLQAGTGEAGRLQVERKHSLLIGGPSMVGTAVASGKAIVEQDVRRAVAFIPNPLLPETRAELALPLRTRGRVMGALTVQSTERHAFSDEIVAVLQNLADQLATAIETATLFEQTQESLAETNRLYDASQQISAARNPQEVFEALVNYSSQIDFVDVAQIIVNDPDDDAFLLSPAVWSRAPLANKAPAIYMREKYQFGEYAIQNKLLIFEDALTDKRVDDAMRDWFLSNHLRSSALIALQQEDEWLGALALFNHALNAFNEKSLQPFLTLTDQAAVILANQRLLREVQAANEQLRQLDQLKTQFLANMSHELRTPLNSIIGFSRVILKGIDGPINQEQEEDLTSIYNNGQHLLRLINEVLDMAKIEAGKMELAFEIVDLKSTLHGALETIRSLTQEKGLELRAHIEPDLPNIEADAVRLRQILNNLLSNAVKYTDLGFVSLTARKEGANHVRITVKDSGIGISQNDFDKLFAAFAQVDSSTTRAVGGTGLGLPITKWLVTMHQGSIMVESRVGEGSTFHVTLPLHQDETLTSQMTFSESLEQPQ